MNKIVISILTGLGGMFGWGIYDFLGSVYSKQLGPYKSFFWSQLSGFISIFLLGIALSVQINPPTVVLILFPIAAITYTAGYLLFFKGFEIGNVSIVATTMNLWAGFTMFFAFVFMGQRLSPFQTAGVLMIFSGVALGSLKWEDLRNKSLKLTSGVREAVMGALFFGIFWNISEIITEEVGWIVSTLIIKFGIVLLLLIFSFYAKREIEPIMIPRKTLFILVGMGIIETAAVAVVNYGLMIGDAILITPISSALSIVTVAMAIIFLKERISKLQGVGILLTLLGIVTTAF